MKKRVISLIIVITLLFSILSVDSWAQRLNELPLDEGPVTIRPLVILVDFPDYRYPEFNEKEKRSKPFISLENYEPDWYNQIYFGEDAYTLKNVWVDNVGQEWVYEYPDNKTFRQYYQEQSKGLYNIEGEVLGWYTAKNDIRYYGDNEEGDQTTACELVQEAVQMAAGDPKVDLSKYDVENKYVDYGDGNYHQPDGVIDTVILVHAGRGEEWGGGSIGTYAIWPFRGKSSWYETPYKKFEQFEVTDTKGNKIKVEDFIVVAQDSLPGIINHEYGHVMNLPDIYNGGGQETCAEWSVMSSNYLGVIPAVDTTSFGAYCRQKLQKDHGGDFARIKDIEYYDIDEKGMDLTIGSLTSDEDINMVRINLPPQVNTIQPYEGEYMYYSQNEDASNNYMSANLDLSDTTRRVYLEFMAMYDIEQDWDYASVQVREKGKDEWTSIEGNLTTTENPNKGLDGFERNPGYGITGSTGGEWMPARFDLSQYAGKNIDFKFHLFTDSNTPNLGMYVDNIKVTSGNDVIFYDDAEEGTNFEYHGFIKENGVDVYGHYYLLELRNHKGIDACLGEYAFGYWLEHTSRDPGLVIWYVNESLGTKNRLDQATHIHPGYVSVGVVDADQSPNYEINAYGDKPVSANILRDSAFSLKKGSYYIFDNWGIANLDKNLYPRPLFDDGKDYTNPIEKQLGLVLQNYGLNILMTEESADGESAKIHIQNAENAEETVQEVQDITIKNMEVNSNNEVILEVAGDDIGFNAYVCYVADTEEGVKEYIQPLELLNGKYRGKIDSTIVNPGEEWEVKYIIVNGKDNSQGKRVYFSTTGDNQKSSMSTYIDLRKAQKPDLKFKIMYDIEKNQDYGSVQVREAGEDKWTAIKGNITTSRNNNGKDGDSNESIGKKPDHGITGTTNGRWVDAEFDLEEYAGKVIELMFYYWTDDYTSLDGMYVSDIKVTDGERIIFDDMEGPSKFTLDGFTNELPSREYNVKGFYNSKTNSGYGLDLKSGNFKKDKLDINYVDLPEYFTHGDYGDITVEISNNTKVMAEASLVVGLYSKDEKVMYSLVSTNKQIQPKATEQMNINLYIPETGEYKVKAFVISNLTDGTVLSKEIEIPVK